jgi:hypothetical protein
MSISERVKSQRLNGLLGLLLHKVDPVIEYVRQNPHEEGTGTHARDEVIKSCHGKRFTEYERIAKDSGKFDREMRPLISLKNAVEDGVAKVRAEPHLTAQIAGEIHIALGRLGANEQLLAIVGSWRDTLDDAAVLRMLGEYNAGRPTLHRPQ